MATAYDPGRAFGFRPFPDERRRKRGRTFHAASSPPSSSCASACSWRSSTSRSCRRRSSEIQAGLSASADEIPWVQTSYLIAEVIAIPLSGYLSRALGTRMLFAVAAAGFTFASVMCGLSSSIDSMIVWRAVQGFIGGGMVPTVFAAAYIIFPGPQQKLVAPVVGLIATLAPTIGPTVGGYVTEAAVMALAVLHQHRARHRRHRSRPGSLVDFDKPDYSLLDRFDWWGLLSMAGFLGALEYVLEEGPRKDWFDDSAIHRAGDRLGGVGGRLLRACADRR